MYHTHHGPVTHMLDGKWVVTKINWNPVNALRQSYTRTKLSGHDEFRKMMDIRTNSSNNTVYADSQGNIAYYHGNFVPCTGYSVTLPPPDAADYTVQDIQPWGGFRPVTPTGQPNVGATGIAGLFVNTGHGSLGWTVACATAEAAASRGNAFGVSNVSDKDESDLSPANSSTVPRRLFRRCRLGRLLETGCIDRASL